MGARHPWAGQGVLRSCGRQPVEWFAPPCIVSGRWSSGMILASGARGRGFNSRTAPMFFVLRACTVGAGRAFMWGNAHLLSGAYSSAVEHGIADPAVAGSIPAAPFAFAPFGFCSVACEAMGRGNTQDMSLWPNWTRRLTTNQKIGGSSPSRDIFFPRPRPPKPVSAGGDAHLLLGH